MIKWFTSYYHDKNPARQAEIDFCIEKLIAHPQIDKVCLLSEVDIRGTKFWESKKITFIPFTRRATYRDFFTAANESSQMDDIMIIANSDIYPGSLDRISEIKANECWALSRWDLQQDGSLKPFLRADSQDVWIFKSMIDGGINGNFPLGTPGCDNRIAYEIALAGYKVTNPSMSLIFVHVHLSGIRNYELHGAGISKDTVPPPYKMIEPSALSGVKNGKRIIENVLHVGMPVPPLQKAFNKIFPVYDYINWQLYPGITLMNKLTELVTKTKYDLVFLHIQCPDVFHGHFADHIRYLQGDHKPIIVNWTGDVRAPLPKWYIDLGKHIDLTLFSNETDVDTARKLGIKSDFLQVGFDDEIFKPGAAKLRWPKVVFLGNNYDKTFPLSQLRKDMVHALIERYGIEFGLYGAGWGNLANGNYNNDQNMEADIYRGAKVAINLSHFDYDRYSSDRLLRIMGTGGAMCLTHKVKGLQNDFPGMFAQWDSEDGIEMLLTIVQNLLHFNKKAKEATVPKASKHIHDNYTWTHQIEKLLNLINCEKPDFIGEKQMAAEPKVIEL